MSGIIYPNPMSTAQSIINILNSKQKQYSLRPWNQFKPEETHWLLVPSVEWPAYKYGKFIVGEEDGVIFCGMNIEKGFASTVATAYPATLRRGLIINDTWAWTQFLNDLNSGIINSVISKIQENIDIPVFIRFSASIATDPTDFEPYKPKAYHIVLKIEEDSIIIADDSESGILSPIKMASNIKEIAHVISRIDDLDWIWIDCDIFVKLNRSESISNTENLFIMKSNELYEKVLLPFKPWCEDRSRVDK